MRSVSATYGVGFYDFDLAEPSQPERSGSIFVESPSAGGAGADRHPSVSERCDPPRDRTRGLAASAGNGRRGENRLGEGQHQFPDRIWVAIGQAAVAAVEEVQGVLDPELLELA